MRAEWGPRSIRACRGQPDVTFISPTLNVVTQIAFCRCYRIDSGAIPVERPDSKFLSPWVRVSELLSVLTLLIRQ